MRSSHDNAALRSAASHPSGTWIVGIGIVFAAAAAVALFPFLLQERSIPAPAAIATIPRLRESLVNLRMILESSMIDAYERGFHGAGHRPAMIDIHPGIHDNAPGEPAVQPCAEPL